MRFESVLARQVSRYRQPQLRLWPFVKFRWVLWVLMGFVGFVGFMGSCGFRGEIRVGSALTSQPSPSEPIRTHVPHPATTYALPIRPIRTHQNPCTPSHDNVCPPHQNPSEPKYPTTRQRKFLPIRTHQNPSTPSCDNASPRTFLLKNLLFIFFLRNFA